jgi:hypothetical protein
MTPANKRARQENIMKIGARPLGSYFLADEFV